MTTTSPRDRQVRIPAALLNALCGVVKAAEVARDGGPVFDADLGTALAVLNGAGFIHGLAGRIRSA